MESACYSDGAAKEVVGPLTEFSTKSLPRADDPHICGSQDVGSRCAASRRSARSPSPPRLPDRAAVGSASGLEPSGCGLRDRRSSPHTSSTSSTSVRTSR